MTTIGTLIRRDLSDAAIRQIQSNHELSPEDRQELEALYARTLERMEKAALILMSRESVRAGEFIREKEQINIQARLSRKARLERPLPVQSASANVIDMIDCLRRINSHLTSLGYAIVRNALRSGEAEAQIAQIEEKEMSPAELEPKGNEKRALLDDKMQPARLLSMFQPFDLGFARLLAELKRRADSAKPSQVLLLLDNVDRPKLLAPAQIRRLPWAVWLQVMITTRLLEHELFGRRKDVTCMTLNGLPQRDALALIERFQPGGTFLNDVIRETAHDIVRLLGGFTLAVERAAIYLGHFARDLNCTAFRDRLGSEGLKPSSSCG